MGSEKQLSACITDVIKKFQSFTVSFFFKLNREQEITVVSMLIN